MIVVKMQFGSHVYGTNLPTSDLDYKQIYIPKGSDILLQRVKNTIIESTGDSLSKNSSGDIDIETFSLQRYLTLLAQGQTVAIDMLFTPDEFILEKSSVWDEIKMHKKQLIPSQCTSFVRYCRSQANKYGIKGSRMGTIKRAISFFDNVSDHYRVEECWSSLIQELDEDENISFIELSLNKQQPETVVPHIDICGRKFSHKQRVKEVSLVLRKIYDNYGQRAMLAEKNEGIDWKALMHAVRISKQAKELVTTGNLSFPRPESKLLLKIRKGELPFKEVALLLDKGIKELEGLLTKSVLIDRVDLEWIDRLVENSYRKEVLRGQTR